MIAIKITQDSLEKPQEQQTEVTSALPLIFFDNLNGNRYRPIGTIKGGYKIVKIEENNE